ncbi:hypothetical protein [Streptomyces sp. XD-27]|uniref:hypothetical protein n=1 Tax=Streptomyces sp. XD-27 TaxID=3062779 RepID=UPI0026F47819|nr:hypothetical protein [Streptomyces sp. XD-27]WKX71760.1 hypothetical protein Q3Y56_19280 [Streptomyces sp. XD-27]
MESGPAIFAGTAFMLFGLGLVLWTAVRVRLRRPVAEGAHPVTGPLLSLLIGAAALGGGIWCLGSV